MSKKIYAGVNMEVPIYEETQTPIEGLSNSNYAPYFSTSDSGSGFVNTSVNLAYGGYRFRPSNIGTDNTTATRTLTAKADLKNVKVYCEYKTEKSWDKVTTTIAGAKVMDAVSGTDNISLNLIWSGDLASGETIYCYFEKDGSQSASGEKVYWEILCDPLTETTTEIVGYEHKDVAKKARKLYWPVLGQIPVYGEVDAPIETLSYKNYDTLYFNKTVYASGNTLSTSTTNGTPGLRFYPNNTGSGYDTSTGGMKLAALHDLKNVKVYCQYYTYSHNKVSVTVADEIALDKVSGGSSSATLNLVWSGDLSAGDVIDCMYSRSGVTRLSSEQVYWEIACDPPLVKTEGIVGYEERLVAKRVIKGYYGVDGVARQFFLSGAFDSYTGDYTVSQVEVDGTKYDLYTVTSSGVLILNDPAQIWMCGAGGAGTSGNSGSTSCFSGFGGDGAFVHSGVLESGEYVVTIGAGAACNGSSSQQKGASTTVVKTSDGTKFEAAGGGNETSNGVDGSSGGGGRCGISSGVASSYSPRTGSYVSTYPFGITDLKAHCAGGGGGTAAYRNVSGGSWVYCSGGDGGSNGGSGFKGTTTVAGSYSKGNGGVYGGGDGGTPSASAEDAYFYGSGGGGGRAYCNDFDGGTTGFYQGGSGYQGVCYLLVPA